MFDSVLGWGYGIAALFVALGVAYGMGRVLSIDSAPGRNQAIDGLRGYLAFGVFLHHAAIWYAYAHGGAWALPPPSVYRALGPGCVSVFFMVTAYLFIGKLLDGRDRQFDWLALFVSRAMRLTPLYLLAMAALFGAVGLLSGWALREPAMAVLGELADWLAFSMLDTPAVNGVPSTHLLIGGVTWSLAYEWLFYLTLPALGVLLGVRVPWPLVISCAAVFAVLVWRKPDLIFPNAFAKGALAAVIARQPRIAASLRGPWWAPVVLIGAGMVVFGAGPRGLVSTLATIAFCIVACGNTVFGLLSNRAAIVLGDVSYGIYLLHGLLLSATFMALIGAPRAAAFGPAAHWAVIMAAGAVVVVIAAVTYRFIEAPAMRRVNAVVAAIRRSGGGAGHATIHPSRPA